MEHRDIQKGQIHVIHNFEFTDITERDAYTPSAEDLKKICLVNSPFSYYALRSISPTVWEGLGGGTTSSPVAQSEITKSGTNPTTNQNPSELGSLHVNYITPEIFICTDNTVDQNIWRGIFSGKIISNAKIFNYDIFKDGSCVSLLTLENEFVNAGAYAITQNNMTFDNSVSGKGLLSTNEKCSIDINGKMQSMSFFIKFPETVTNNNYFYDCRGYGNANTFSYIGTNITLSRTGSEAIYQNGGRVYEGGGQFKKNEWVHIAINFNTEISGIRLLNNNANPPSLGLNGVTIDQIRCFNRALTVGEIATLSTEIY